MSVGGGEATSSWEVCQVQVPWWGEATCSQLTTVLSRALFFFFLIFIGVELIYNIVLVSALQQSESVIHIPIATLF